MRKLDIPKMERIRKLQDQDLLTLHLDGRVPEVIDGAVGVIVGEDGSFSRAALEAAISSLPDVTERAKLMAYCIYRHFAGVPRM